MHSANNNKTQKLDSAYNSLCVLVEAYSRKKTSKRSSAQEYLHISSLHSPSFFSKFFVHSHKHILFRKEYHRVSEREKQFVCGLWRHSICFEFPVCSFIHARTLNFPRILDMEVTFETFFAY
jgi:hypothetical protein